MSGAVVALCGGIGGAKLALGLARTLDPHDLTIVVNTGDDFEHLGLSISPDIDTVLYAGRRCGSRTRVGPIRRDVALHGSRSRTRRRRVVSARRSRPGPGDLEVVPGRMAEGGSHEAFVARASTALGIRARILPMTSDPVRTIVETSEGTLPFQRYFVEHRCAPVVRSLRFEGAARATPATGLLAALSDSATRAIVICPSNLLSIDPILAVWAFATRWPRHAPVIAVSPIIGGRL
jgi:LPPG:FO 2-phospho-L-lactate transferase